MQSVTAVDRVAVVAELLHRVYDVGPRERAVRVAGRAYLANRRRRRGSGAVVAAANDSGDDAGNDEHTGGMVCLVPDAASARRLVLTGDGAEPADQLHLTLAYLGDDVTGWPADVRDELPAAVRTAIGATAGFPGVVRARVFSHSTFNADGGPAGDRDPCAVYGIGDSALLAPLQRAVVAALRDVDGLGLPKQHEPWVPHVTATYKGTAADLSFLGPVVFDRVAVVLGPRWHYLPLGAETTTAVPADEGTVIELAARQVGRSRQHVPGTPYNWRHGWVPLNVATALMWRKRRAAQALHSSGAQFGDDRMRPVAGGLTARAINPADLDDDRLEAGMQTAIRAERWDLLDSFGAEAERRDTDRARRAERADRDRIRRQQRADELLDQMGLLVDEGVPEAEAWGQVYGRDPDQFRRREAIRVLREQGYKGAGFDELARDSFRAHVAAEFLRAEEATRGVMLSRQTEGANARAAARRGRLIDPQDLFTGNAATARKHASQELRSWWDANGRPTLDEWKAQLLGDVNAARNLRARRDAMIA